MNNETTANIIFGLIGSVIGALLIWLSENISRSLRTRRGELSGLWYQIIPQHGTEPNKIDRVECKQINDRLTGNISRIFPPNQRFKEWEFEAKTKRNLLFGTFWSRDTSKNPGSYGTLQLNIIDEKHLEGFYVRLLTVAAEEGTPVFTNKLERIPFSWKKASSTDELALPDSSTFFQQ